MPLRSLSLKTSTGLGGLGVREMTREEAQRRAAEEAGTGRTMRAWAILVPERGVPLDLDEFPYQEEWYSEEVARAREAVWQKAAQVGMSAYAFRWAMRRAEQFADTVIYFFPTDDDVTEFGEKRIEPSIEDSEFLLRRIRSSSIRHKHLKEIAGGWLSLRGTQSKSAVQSVDADALVFDEYDYLNVANLAQAERRLAGSKQAGREPRIRRFGYPTLPGSGINALYERSDKRVWHVTCPDCGKEQSLHWEESMRWRTVEGGPVMRLGHDEFDDQADVAEAWRVCKHCEASLETPRGVRGPLHAGRWKPTRESNVIGFHVPRLIVPRTDRIELVQNSRKTSISDREAFWNNDLGLPYSPAEASLSEEAILAACSLGGPLLDSYRVRGVIIGGLDVASERDLSIWVDELLEDGTTKAIHISEPEDFEEVARLMRSLRINLLIVDSMPDRRQARALAKTFPGRVHLAVYDYRNDADAFRYDPKKNLITVNRTEAIDEFMDSVRQLRRIPLEKPPARFVSQLMSPKRRTELDTKERPIRVYYSTGPDGDDYAHSGVYATVGKEMWVLRERVKAQEAAKRGQPLPSERFGLGGVDEYEPGFAERRPSARRRGR